LVERDKRIVILLSEKEREKYDRWCLDNKTTKTKDLREHILERISRKTKEAEKK
jgi:hypothetical protein